MEKSSGSTNTPLFLSVRGGVEKGGLEGAMRRCKLTSPETKNRPAT